MRDGELPGYGVAPPARSRAPYSYQDTNPILEDFSSLNIAANPNKAVVVNATGDGYDLVPAIDPALYAPLASPAFTGTPTAPTAAPGTNTTQLSTTAFVTLAIAALINSAPGTLDTLDELAAALGDDSNFAATMTAALAGKQPLDADLTAIAALVTTAFGRTFLDLADAAAGRTKLALVPGTDVQAFDAQLTDLAGLVYAGNALKVVRVNAGATSFELATPSGGGAGTGGLATVTLPSARYEWEELVAAVGVTPASRIILSLAPALDADENDPVFLALQSLSASPGTDQMTVSMAFAEPTRGPIKLNWSAM